MARGGVGRFDRTKLRFVRKSRFDTVALRALHPIERTEVVEHSPANAVLRVGLELDAAFLFEGIDGYGNGEQVRDFIYVKDVVKVNFFFWDHPELKGIYNCGTGHAHTFNTLAKGVLKYFGSGELEYVPFPEVLKGKYQSFTEADSSKLLAAGYDGGFTDIEEAIAEYCALLDKNDGYLINER